MVTRGQRAVYISRESATGNGCRERDMLNMNTKRALGMGGACNNHTMDVLKRHEEGTCAPVAGISSAALGVDSPEKLHAMAGTC
jgi:hypothetical protein